MDETRCHSIVVMAPMKPSSISMDETGTKPVIPARDEAAESWDPFNKPRLRRAIILKAFEAQFSGHISFQTPSAQAEPLTKVYADVHTEGLLDFITTAWSRWVELGDGRRNPGSAFDGRKEGPVAPLIPINVPLPRDPYQRPSTNVMGAVGFYCSDQCTPIVETLLEELLCDSTIIQSAVDKAMDGALVYAMPTHPGHHASKDCFGGYCYLNQAGLAARIFRHKYKKSKVAILDIDYHCGNGTASIFYDDPSVLVVSLHCDPDFDYPFHSGFPDQIGVDAGEGTTLHLPMPPKTVWQEYQKSLTIGLQKISEFGAEAVVISMGLDTHEGDPCALPGAGFGLHGHDYWMKGQMMAQSLKGIPIVIIQEGGYRMETIGESAVNVVMGYFARSEKQV